MLIRFGIRFEPKRADILDLIDSVTNGRGGIAIESLISVFYHGKPKKSAAVTMRVHISEINSMLISTDYRIVNEGGFYKLKEMAA